MMASTFLERSVVIRELMPQDLKLEIDQLSRDEAVEAARYLAEVVSKAHARQMDSATRRKFAKSLNVRRSSQLDAPSWLWSSVVELAPFMKRVPRALPRVRTGLTRTAPGFTITRKYLALWRGGQAGRRRNARRPIFLAIYLLCPWWLAICIMHFCFISLSDRPVFLDFSEVMQAFIFGSCPTLSPVLDGVVAFDESLFMLPLGSATWMNVTVSL